MIGLGDSMLAYTNFAAFGIELLNMGAPGENVGKIMARFPMVLGHHPKTLLLMGGTNNGIYDQGESQEQAAAMLIAGACVARARGIRVLIGKIPPRGFTHSVPFNALLTAAAVCAGLARSLVDFYTPYVNAQGNRIESYFVDSAHFSYMGKLLYTDILKAKLQSLPCTNEGTRTALLIGD